MWNKVVVTGDGKQQTECLKARDFKGCEQLNETLAKTVFNNQFVRRLTPLECCRLQGYPDYWHIIPSVEDMTDDEYEFWAGVYITDKQIKGKTAKKPTKKQIISWHNKLGSDSSYYKAYGNSLALPCAFYVVSGVANALTEDGLYQR